MARLKNVLIVDIDSERKETVIIGRTQDYVSITPGKEVIDDMGFLCEAICTLIHAADQAGVKKLNTSLLSCIKHLQDGCADPSYKGKIVDNYEPDFTASNN